MNTRGSLRFLGLLFGAIPAALAVQVQWEEYMAGVFKQPCAVELARDPFQALGAAHPANGTLVATRSPLSERACEQLLKGLKGYVCSGPTPCILFGRRIVCVGQELSLMLEDAGGRRELRLKLREVSPDQLLFHADEEAARMLGSADWACPNRKGGRR